MKLRLISNACVSIKTEDTSILTDPWLVGPAFGGSWFQWPPLNYDTILEEVGPHDYIWISHAHEDHLHVPTLRRYLSMYPKTVVTGNAPFVQKILTRAGLPYTPAPGFGHDNTMATVFTSTVYGGGRDIDSALVVNDYRTGHSAVLMVDCPWEPELLGRILDHQEGEPIDVAFLPFSGAGAYPQVFDLCLTEKTVAAALKRYRFLETFNRFREALAPRIAVPYAGSYVLGGKLWPLNAYRGVPDPTILAPLNGVKVLDPGGTVDLDPWPVQITGERLDEESPMLYAESLSAERLDYEREPEMDPGEIVLQLYPMLREAAKRAVRHSRVDEDYYLYVRLDDIWFFTNMRRGSDDRGLTRDPFHTPREEFTVDPRLLKQLLAHEMHWDTAYIGSLYSIKREGPFRREVADFHHFFAV